MNFAERLYNSEQKRQPCENISQIKDQLDATLCRFYLLGPPALIRRCDDLPATITHVPVTAVLVLNTPDDGRLRPKHVE